MTPTILSPRRLLLGCAALAVALVTATAQADDEDGKGKGKGKGKDQRGDVIQVDLSKLPPDLAKALRRYAADGKKSTESKKGATKAKATGEKKRFTIADLPPGLARKPPTHPGRMNWLRAHGLTEPATKGKGKGKAKRDDDDD